MIYLHRLLKAHWSFSIWKLFCNKTVFVIADKFGGVYCVTVCWRTCKTLFLLCWGSKALSSKDPPACAPLHSPAALGLWLQAWLPEPLLSVQRRQHIWVLWENRNIGKKRLGIFLTRCRNIPLQAVMRQEVNGQMFLLILSLKKETWLSDIL